MSSGNSRRTKRTVFDQEPAPRHAADIGRQVRPSSSLRVLYLPLSRKKIALRRETRAGASPRSIPNFWANKAVVERQQCFLVCHSVPFVPKFCDSLFVRYYSVTLACNCAILNRL